MLVFFYSTFSIGYLELVPVNYEFQFNLSYFMCRNWWISSHIWGICLLICNFQSQICVISSLIQMVEHISRSWINNIILRSLLFSKQWSQCERFFVGDRHSESNLFIQNPLKTFLKRQFQVITKPMLKEYDADLQTDSKSTEKGKEAQRVLQ